MLYDRNIISPSSEIFGYLRQSSENVRKPLSSLWNNFGKSSQMFGKWSEIFRLSKTSLLVSLYNKQNITCPLLDMNFIFSSWTLKDKIQVHAQACNILYIVCFLEININNVQLLVIQEVPCYCVKSECVYWKEKVTPKTYSFVNAIWKPWTCRFWYWMLTPKPTIWASLHNIVNSTKQPGHLFLMSFLLRDFVLMASHKPFDDHSRLWHLLSYIILSQTCSKHWNSIEDSKLDNCMEKKIFDFLFHKFSCQFQVGQNDIT